MDSTISFHGPNHGVSMGINYSSVTNEFHLSRDCIERLSPVYGAAFDSYEDQHEDQCLPGTRTALLSQIKDWAASPQGKCIFWLNGLAGTGKSTISRTIATSFHQSDLLVASFFFKRSEGDRGNARRLFPTIAAQLAMSVPEIKPLLEEAIRNNPGISTKAMREQFQELILRPFQGLEKSQISTQTLVIVIDALDECEGDDDIRLILQLLPQLGAVHLRVFLTSRPDLPVRLGFSKITGDVYKDFVLHDIPLEVVSHDISLFLDCRLKEIRTDRSLPANWPDTRSFQKLVELSVPLFIFAATLCRIFEEPDWDPMASLTEILTSRNGQSQLDKTYLPVIDRLLNRQHERHKEKMVSEFQLVIGAIVTLESPLSVCSLSKLLELPEQLIQLRLDPLHSVLRVPPANARTVPVRLFHLSFRDFLLDPDTRKKTPLAIDEIEVHCKLATQCFLMCRKLRRNICGLSIYGTERTEIARQTIDINLPPELRYACRYGIFHLIRCIESERHLEETDTYPRLCLLTKIFLEDHFLYWVEAMSILGLTSEILSILDRLQRAISENESFLSSHLDFLHDTRRFILKFHHIIDRAPLQVYCAGLIFAPRTSIMYERFKHKIPPWIYRLPRVEDRWGAALQILEGHSKSIYSVVFSPNGQCLASSSTDKYVRLWDSVTGAPMHVLESPDESSFPRAIAFSPDSQLLACACGTKMWLWDPATGILTQTLNMRNCETIICLAFSSDGQLLAYGTKDGTLQIWDLEAGMPIHTLDGHTGSVTSVAFSPKRRLLAASCNDEILRIWDLAVGTLTKRLMGHSKPICSVAFSPNGKLLASGSRDATVRLWDLEAGAPIEILVGHMRSVTSVTFSPNGRLLASGSSDHAVRLWDLAKGLNRTLNGHLYSVQSVVFAPNGQFLASGSEDETIRLWDPAAAGPTQILKGHARWVRSMAFSPNGHLLVSGSHGREMLLWDSDTGSQVETFPVGRAVTEVGFSSDGLSVKGDDSTFDIQYSGYVPTLDQPHTDLEISLVEMHEWITLNGKKALWLPVDFRPMWFKVKGDTLALAHKTGHVSFLKFCM